MIILDPNKYYNLGSVSMISDLNVTVSQYIEYIPFGEEMYSAHRNTYNSPYRYTAKELDEETGLYYYGARYYNPKLSIWLSVDPMVEEAPDWTPYRFCYNNPIRFTDPDGRWEADSDGNLIAKKNDNAQTLADYQGTTYSQALKQMKDQGYTTTRKGKYDVLNLKIGDKVTLDNVYTESIKNSTSDYTLDNAKAGTSKIGPTPEDDYNSWGSAIAGSQGKKIEVGVGIPNSKTFVDNLDNDYTPTTATNAKFGKTVLHFSNSKGTQHGAVFYGKNKAGEIYVYTKNGWYLKPEVMKLSELIKKIPNYGTVQGINLSESGYYDPK